MQIGDPSTFAIECAHEPIPNANRWVFGRMCLWVDGRRFGNFNEPACMLNVTAHHLAKVLERLPTLQDPALESLSDAEVFSLLDRAIYVEDGSTPEKVAADAARFFKFDFLTAAGESFDRCKSFVTCADGEIRLLLDEPPHGLVTGRIKAADFVASVTGFLAWIDAGGVGNEG